MFVVFLILELDRKLFFYLEKYSSFHMSGDERNKKIN